MHQQLNRYRIRPSTRCSWAVCRPSEQDLDDTDVDVLLQQMGGKAVPTMLPTT